jgi:regulator of protease activity HflC (stomatin/prohibitin superfamily)
MTIDPLITPAFDKAASHEQERPGPSSAGLPLLVLGIVCALAAAGLYVLGSADASQHNGATGTAVAAITVAVLLTIASPLLLRGLIAVVPGEARVIQFFGRYTGTIRKPGLRWVNPFTTRRRVSVRIRNLETPVMKVNDLDGNPIDMAAVVVWQVNDTARAVFEVDDFEKFVDIQTETAVRHIANTYPYDARREGQLSLRDNAKEITEKLSEEIAVRVGAAGVDIMESRFTHLAYAPEVAQVMLRRQQAEAVVAARTRIVEGAVGMVHMALNQLAEQGVVELDEERKAAMVSNLLVVLCSDQATHPVVNTGTLYQ